MSDNEPLVVKKYKGKSTSKKDKNAIVVPSTPVEPPIYTFDTRSFHPSQSFGLTGLYFRGDNRGFSLEPSPQATSRIRQQFKLDMNDYTIKDKMVASDVSSHPLIGAEDYKEPAIKPRSTYKPLEHSKFNASGKLNGTSTIIHSWYGGENHTMPFSTWMQKKYKKTYVPTLDVYPNFKIDFYPHLYYIDIMSNVYGDGFPNCESFITDPSGKKLFLGAHVRVGDAANMLMYNFKWTMCKVALTVVVDSKGNFDSSRILVRDNKLNDLVIKMFGVKPGWTTLEKWNDIFLKADPDNGRATIDTMNLRQ